MLPDRLEEALKRYEDAVESLHCRGAPPAARDLVALRALELRQAIAEHPTGLGTVSYRFRWLLDELAVRFPEATRPYAATSEERRYLDAIDALLGTSAPLCLSCGKHKSHCTGC